MDNDVCITKGKYIMHEKIRITPNMDIDDVTIALLENALTWLQTTSKNRKKYALRSINEAVDVLNGKDVLLGGNT